MEHEPHLQTSNILLVAAIAVCTVMGVLTLLPGFRGRSVPPGIPLSIGQVAQPEEPALPGSPQQAQASSGLSGSRPRAASRMSANIVRDVPGGGVSPSVVIPRSVAPGESPVSASDVPQVYVPVTVHPVSVTVDQGSMSQEISRLHDVLEQLRQQQLASSATEVVHSRQATPAHSDDPAAQLESQRQFEQIQSRLDQLTRAVADLNERSAEPARSAGTVLPEPPAASEMISPFELPPTPESPSNISDPNADAPTSGSQELGAPVLEPADDSIDFSLLLNDEAGRTTARRPAPDTRHEASQPLTGPIGQITVSRRPDYPREQSQPLQVPPEVKLPDILAPLSTAQSAAATPATAVPPIPTEATVQARTSTAMSATAAAPAPDSRNTPAPQSTAAVDSPLDMTPGDTAEPNSALADLTLSPTSAPSPYRAENTEARESRDASVAGGTRQAVFQNTYRFSGPDVVAPEGSAASREPQSRQQNAESNRTDRGRPGSGSRGSAALQKPSVRQVRPVPESEKTPVQRGIRYLRSRPWLPDLDMPGWLGRNDRSEPSAAPGRSDNLPLHRAASAIRYATRPAALQD